MRIQIKSKQETINADVAKTNFQKIRGHMFRLKITPLFFEFNRESKFDSAVHMFFVFKPLDLVYINSEWDVVDIQQALPFFPYYSPSKPAKYLLELPYGMSKKFKIGDQLEFSYF